MAALDAAVEGFLTSGLRVVVAVGHDPRRDARVRRRGREPTADKERLRAVRRCPAALSGDGGHLRRLRRRPLPLCRPAGDLLGRRSARTSTRPQGPRSSCARSRARARRGATPGGSRCPTAAARRPRSRPLDYDPRTRPWYIDAEGARRRCSPSPISSRQANIVGVSAGVPLGQGGVIGFDFTLGTLSELIGDYRITPNSIIMVRQRASGVVFMESEACAARPRAVPSRRGRGARGHARARSRRLAGSGERVERDLVLAGRDYRLMVHDMPPALGRRFVVAAAVPVVELSADSRDPARAGRRSPPRVASGSRRLGAPWPPPCCCRARSPASPARPSASAASISPIATPVDSRITEIVRLSDCRRAHARAGWRCSAATCRRTSCTRSCARPRRPASAARGARSR